MIYYNINNYILIKMFSRLRATKKDKRKNTHNLLGKNTTRGGRIKMELMERTEKNNKLKRLEKLKKSDEKIKKKNKKKKNKI